jgi:L-ascorbate metabolism protein UlaG (beta-lactamase superfamily)
LVVSPLLLEKEAQPWISNHYASVVQGLDSGTLVFAQEKVERSGHCRTIAEDEVQVASEELVYLRQNVQVEPLVDQWYAWSHLIPPATAARNFTERHLKIMESYVSAPHVHASAVKDPKMLGGPFIDHGSDCVDEVRALLRQSIHQRQDLIELSKAIGDLDGLLRAKGNGESLHPLYAEIPDPLRGYVELVYDLHNTPSFRLIEPLLYRSPYYRPESQSFMLSLVRGDDRPFVMSTPRLDSEDAVHIRMPFDDPRVDDLFRMIDTPRPWREVRDRYLPDGDDPRFRELFTAEPPRPYEPYRGDGVRWRYFGHACILVETRGLSILLDPVLSYTYEADISRYTYADLPDTIDYVLITHNHQDHVLFETLLQLRHKVKTIVVPRGGHGALQDPSLQLALERIGCPQVQELREGGRIPIPGGEILGLPFFGEHADLDVQTKLAYLVRVEPHSLIFAADSCNVEPRLYEHVHRAVGDVDVVFIGMECDGAPLSWIYGPLLTQRISRAMDQSRRLSGSNYEQAIDIVRRFNAREVYVYAMGQEPWLNHVMRIRYTSESQPIVDSNRLVRECRARGIVAERLFGEKEILLDQPMRATGGAR